MDTRGYTLHVHAAYGGEECILYVHTAGEEDKTADGEKRNTSMSERYTIHPHIHTARGETLAVSMNTPCSSIPLVERDTPASWRLYMAAG
jgi:hypothetical protein